MIKRNKNKKKQNSKKYLCVVCVLIFALLDPVLLCGCASTRDEVALELAEPESTVSKSMTQMSEIEADTKTQMQEIEMPIAIESAPRQVYIYLCGAVALPGVYCLAEGSRLYEAVELAGGLTQEADENCLNMARQITDGEQIVILTLDEAASLKEAGAYKYPTEAAAQASTPQEAGLVNINTATVPELTSVSGIGESRAKAIVDYREKYGRFGSIEDIKNVDGIKDGLFSKIKDKITI
ncbi:MAG: helix-hairpin-helix domain-containing protein [Lachnospiraceae bacterium]|nr:helix-hairpin-helix domain-containing protein [Lachnospiraceae bacterium]